MNSEHEYRLGSLAVAADQGAWGLNDRDAASLRWALAEIARLRAEACRFYRADGSYEVLDSPEACVAKRIGAAKRLKQRRGRGKRKAHGETTS